jgi:hypothetical protein
MPITLGGYTLPVESIDEDCSGIIIESDAWNNLTLKYQHVTTIVGKTFTWVFSCVERNVSWASSIVPVFKAAGDTVQVLTSDLPQRIISSLNVKILNVTVSAANDGELFARRFSITVQQVS